MARAIDLTLPTAKDAKTRDRWRRVSAALKVRNHPRHAELVAWRDRYLALGRGAAQASSPPVDEGPGIEPPPLPAEDGAIPPTAAPGPSSSAGGTSAATSPSGSSGATSSPTAKAPTPAASPKPALAPEDRAREIERLVTLVMMVHNGSSMVIEKQTGATMESFVPGITKTTKECWRMAVEDRLSADSMPTRTIAPWVALLSTLTNVGFAVWLIWRAKKVESAGAPTDAPRPATPAPKAPEPARQPAPVSVLPIQPKTPAPAPEPKTEAKPVEQKPITEADILKASPFRGMPVTPDPLIKA